MEYPRSGTAFSPEASGSPSPQAKNPLGNREEEYSFPGGRRKGQEIIRITVVMIVVVQNWLSGLGLEVLVSESRELAFSCWLTAFAVWRDNGWRWPISRRKSGPAVTVERGFLRFHEGPGAGKSTTRGGP